MKKKFGLELIVLAFIFLFVGSTAHANQPEPGNYTVFEGGGHMEKGDSFVLSRGDTDEEMVLDPNWEFPETMNERWEVPDQTTTYVLNLIGEDYCGFVEVDTSAHEDNRQGPDRHHKLHRIKIKAVGPPDEAKNKEKNYVHVIWSPYPSNKMPAPGKKPEKCKISEDPDHGGIAHANN